MKDRLLALITGVIDEMNQTRDEAIPTEGLLDVGLYGDNTVFDSMGLVSFLAMVEEALEDEFDAEISLTSEKAVSQRVSPFSSVSRLIDFIEEELRLAGVEDEAQEADAELARQQA
jgi:acyl carrier protein